MDLPGFWLQHTVPVEPYEGTNGYGQAVYGTVFNLECLAEDGRKLVRDEDGHEVVSETTLYANRGPSIPAHSRVTLPSGRASKVIVVKDRDGGDLPLPSHLEIVCE